MPTKSRRKAPSNNLTQWVTDAAGNMRQLREAAPDLEFPGMCLGERTKYEYPYSYDPHLQWSAQPGVPENAHGVYSDRMLQWDYNKFRSLCKKHFAGKNGDPGGDYFHQRSPKDIEAFMREYFDKPQLRLVRVEEHCNQGNGFPVWVFYYLDPSETPRQAH